MGSLQLHCPLCCTETFSCHNSLKYHLLSISENLICPSCGDRFEKIFDLAMHLGNQCLDPPVEEVEKIEEVEVLVKTESEDEASVTIANSILAKALNKDLQDAVVDNDNEQSDDVYHCSSCAVNFTSVEEHIKKFHDGHEVFLEEEKTGTSNEPETMSVFVIQEGNSSDKDEDCDTLPGEYLDKGGYLYTRKLVKVEKFWDNVGESDCTETNDAPLEPDANAIVEVYQCQVCCSRYSNFDEFSKHSCKRKLSENVCRKCHICGANFVNAKYLTLHMRTHRPSIPENTNPPFICEICNTELPAFKSLRLHRRMHDPIKSKHIDPPVNYGLEGEEREDSPREKFLCGICCKEYDKEYAEAHKKFHSEEKDYNCDICNRKFFSQENLEMHMHAHAETKKFTCSYCKKGFLSNEKLEAHISAKCQMRQYECQYCGRRFSRPHEKVKHERIHTGEKPYKCEICGKAFRVSYCLTLHMRTHSGTRPYKCDHCGKRFKAHSVYNHHLLTHSDDRKYKCPYCPKTFKTGVQLAGHKNSHIKPFTCTECNRPFASLYAVRAHMATHKRQNNLKYKCWLCGASYARSFALRDHIKEQHYDEHENKDDSTAQLVTVDYIGSIETGESILTDGDGSMLIDIADGQDVDNMELSEVSITPVLQETHGG
ncbi:hypothetical protein RN001_013107 [Aquatica leii]|uniref:C2H2-type domain-containing protein n=1 Tax=Aquatica leii TaxID=1421715 RepID=A0AAN7NZI7_9COLE|nr:hypothetical protein RN001_013107 [Aquatica leii]